MAPSLTGSWLRGYYYLTPLFALADGVLGLDFRVSGLQGATSRFAYYGFCLLCAVLLHFRPRLAALVGMAESSTNLALLMLGVMLPLLRPDGIEAGGHAGLQGMHVVNFIVSGSILLAAFYSAQQRLLRQS